MPAQLTLICAGATASARLGGFASPTESLDEPGLRHARKRALTKPAPARFVTSPSVAARETIAAIGVSAVVVEAIADRDWGAWSGRMLDDLHAASAPALSAWLEDPAAATPGGESHARVVERVVPWLEELAEGSGRTLAVTHPMTARAILTAAIAVPADAALRIDLAPLATVTLSFHRGWRLQEIRRP